MTTLLSCSIWLYLAGRLPNKIYPRITKYFCKKHKSLRANVYVTNGNAAIHYVFAIDKRRWHARDSIPSHCIHGHQRGNPCQQRHKHSEYESQHQSHRELQIISSAHISANPLTLISRILNSISAYKNPEKISITELCRMNDVLLFNLYWFPFASDISSSHQLSFPLLFRWKAFHVVIRCNVFQFRLVFCRENSFYPCSTTRTHIFAIYSLHAGSKESTHKKTAPLYYISLVYRIWLRIVLSNSYVLLSPSVRAHTTHTHTMCGCTGVFAANGFI